MNKTLLKVGLNILNRYIIMDSQSTHRDYMNKTIQIKSDLNLN